MITRKMYWSSAGKRIIIIYIMVALFAPIIANNRPLYISIHGHSYFPALSKDAYFTYYDSSGNTKKLLFAAVDWNKLNSSAIIYAPVRWSDNSDIINAYTSPFDAQLQVTGNVKSPLPFFARHYFGTGKNGHDILASLVLGTRTSILIGFVSAFLALFIGFLTGAIAGYFGDSRLKLRLGNLILLITLIIPAFFYSSFLRKESIADAFQSSLSLGVFQIFISIFLFILILLPALLFPFKKIPILKNRINIHTDTILSRAIEIFLSLPRLVLILCFAAFVKPSLLSIILIIGFTSWTEIARITRAQVLQMRQINFIEASGAMGNSDIRIIFRHILPNILPQLTVMCIYLVASAILIESSLSFLGIGLPPGNITWGGTMYEARENFQAWWIVFSSGAAISLLMFALYRTADKLRTFSATNYNLLT